MTLLKLRGLYDSKVNSLSHLISLLKNIESGSFIDKTIKDIPKNKEKISKLRDTSRNVIMSEVYNKWPEGKYERTYQLLESFDVFSRSDGGIKVASDFDVASSKTGSDEGIYSYAGFFQEPSFGQGSFIHPRDDDRHPVRYRPYMRLLSEALSNEFSNIVHSLFISHIKRSMPGRR
jgi:hypothetical protein